MSRKPVRPVISSLALLCCVLISGCGGGAAVPDPPGSRRFGPLLFTLTQPKSVYARDETVSWTLSVKNTSNAAVHIVAGTTCWTKFTISQNGAQIYPGYGCNDAIVQDDIPAGSTREYTTTWNQKDIFNNPTPPGVDTINAWFAGSSGGAGLSDDQVMVLQSPAPEQFTVNP